MNKKVLITGADGFIGNNLVNALLDKEIEIFAIVYPGHNIYDTKEDERLHVICIDLNEIMNYTEEFPKDIDVMYHFAWTGVNPEMRNDFDVQMSNINMSMQCMRFAAAIGIKRVVFPGSTNEYLYYGKPINKYAIPSPNNAYGAVKVAVRYLCSNFAVQNSIEFMYTIVTGIYASDRRDNNVIFYTIDKLLHGEKPSLTKLEQLWDYVYIDDVVEAFRLVGEKGKGGAIYAIGHGDNWPLYNYIKIIHQKIDASLPIGIGDIPYNSNVLPCSCIDLNDIHKDTGFVPKIDFEEGITKVIDCIKSEMEHEI